MARGDAGGGQLLKRLEELAGWPDRATALHAAEIAVVEELRRLGGDYGRAANALRDLHRRGWEAIREEQRNAERKGTESTQRREGAEGGAGWGN